MPVSPKKRASNKAYNQKCDRIEIRPLKPTGTAIRAAAEASGQSLQAYIVQACQERMEREGLPTTLSLDENNKTE